MSEATANITMRYQPLQGGDAESRWIRIEQERPEDEALTLDEAAEIIDTLYDIQPCDEGGMSGGGEEATEEPPEREKFDAAMQAMLRKSGVCKQAEYWIATVRIMRSHRQPGYVLRSETAEVETTTPVTESHRQFVQVSGATIELDMPYEGGLTGIPAGIKWAVRGSTVNLDRPVLGSLVLRYTTYYERVALRVPVKGNNTPTAASQRAASGGTIREELPGAAVVAFWADLAASCDLQPPEVDDSLSREELDEICSRMNDSSGGGIHDDSPNDCWRTVRHYSRCNCSYKKIKEYTSLVAAPCDGAESGSTVGHEERFGGFELCPGEEDDVSDIEFYKEKCCHGPSKLLPRCRTIYQVYNGGEEIDGGPERWKKIYGDDVNMVAVMPKGGVCGEKIIRWNVQPKNCCDEVEPLRPHPDNPSTIHIPRLSVGSIILCVQGGDADHPQTWSVSGGYYFAGEKQVVENGGPCQAVYGDPDLACDNGAVNVDDGCSRTSMAFSRENPSEPMILTPDFVVVSPGGYATFSATGNQGHVQWTADTLRLISAQGGVTALFEVPDGFCGRGEVLATDACGKMARAVVLSTEGRWVEQTDFNPCAAPWSGAAPATNGYVANYQGWRANVAMAASGGVQFHPPEAHGGSCEAAWAGAPPSVHANVPCGFTNNEIYRNADGSPAWTEAADWACASMSTRTCYPPLCWNNWDGVNNNTWGAAVQYIERLWKWECGNEQQ